METKSIDARKEEYTKMVAENEYLCKLAKISNRQPKHLLPRLLFASNSITKINRFVPNPLEIWEETKSFNALEPTVKIQTFGHGDWDFSVDVVKKSHFSQRSDFDDVVLQRSWSCFGQVIPKFWDTISIPRAFKEMGVTLKLNVEQILDSGNDEQKEAFQNQVWMLGKEKAEEKLEKNMLTQIFGKPENGDKLEFRNFKKYFEGGNCCHGTAEYNANYIYLCYQTS